MTATSLSAATRKQLVADIKATGRALGFQAIGITDVELDADARHLERWLTLGRHGEMHYMARNKSLREQPAQLHAGTMTVISARMDYWPKHARSAEEQLESPDRAYIARYALGRDYHKVLRKRLQQLANEISERIGDFGYRVFVDSAPVLEKALARKAGLGWIGKHTNLIDRQSGSWFFIGEVFTDLPLPTDEPVTEHCGTCRACIDVCPTRAIVAPYELDARRCIAYLTIEFKGSIPLELRPMMGNRIFGCDDCQLFCPWNRYATATAETDFAVRHNLDSIDLLNLFSWTQEEWSLKTAGSAIRRAGYDGWLRNIAVALGNAPPSARIRAALVQRQPNVSALVAEHIQWALQRQQLNLS